jgi:uncharacterized protein
MGTIEPCTMAQGILSHPSSRRMWLRCAGVGLILGNPSPNFAFKLAADQQLNSKQSRAFRAWFSAIVEDQVQRNPTPRWVHRDCAGLVRFAAREALQAHTSKWLPSMGWPSTYALPLDVEASVAQQKTLSRWNLQDGSRSDYASAISLVQSNARRVATDSMQTQSGDLLFFDQGGEQHLMVWTGKRIAYHTGGQETADDNGLRATTLSKLLQHPDTRWRPNANNPNFAGWYRFTFLTP